MRKGQEKNQDDKGEDDAGKAIKGVAPQQGFQQEFAMQAAGEEHSPLPESGYTDTSFPMCPLPCSKRSSRSLSA